MSAERLLGKPVAAALKERLTVQAEALRSEGVVPTLALVRVGEKPEDLSYEKSLLARCRDLGAEARQVLLPEAVDQAAALEAVEKLNRDPTVHGILLFRPLPGHLDEAALCAALDPEKDLDGITPGSLAGVFMGSGVGFAPCTAQACMEILDHYQIPLAGKRAAVVGRSLVVGRPLAALLLAKNATVTLCHSKTEDLPQVLQNAELILAAAGKPRLLGRDCFAPGQTVLDVGIHVLEDGSLCGDVDLAQAEEIVKNITPVPGGVGPVTTWVLMEHLLQAASKKSERS